MTRLKLSVKLTVKEKMLREKFRKLGSGEIKQTGPSGTCSQPFG